ncbi:MAG: hypothetical protein ACNA7Q_07985 [Rhodobacterales bacterium]
MVDLVDRKSGAIHDDRITVIIRAVRIARIADFFDIVKHTDQPPIAEGQFRLKPQPRDFDQKDLCITRAIADIPRPAAPPGSACLPPGRRFGRPNTLQRLGFMRCRRIRPRPARAPAQAGAALILGPERCHAEVFQIMEPPYHLSLRLTHHTVAVPEPRGRT